jgi:hypothetical protein
VLFRSYTTLSGGVRGITIPNASFNDNDTIQTEYFYTIPEFSFMKDYGLALPLLSMRNDTIKFNVKFKPKENKKYLIIGNPPFGKSSSIAIKFFNKAALFSECIAFILPRTFKRISIQNRLDLNFSLIYTKDLPVKPCCFIPKMEAKCCFQI